MEKQELFQEAIDAILNCDPTAAVDIATKAIQFGVNPAEMLDQGFAAGIREMGELFGSGQAFLPQLILAAQTMQAATDILNVEIKKSGEVQNRGKMVFATVAGDVHDIGKGIVVSMLGTQGIEIIDLGRDVPIDTIIEAAVEAKADIIGTSALLTTTMVQQQKLEEELKKRGIRENFKTIIGGAPCTQRWADKIGADAYAEDAAEAVEKVVAMLSARG
jgi:trimethylamine corrinoid protein